MNSSVNRPLKERRRNPRHGATSIVYLQFGSGNGGIVINLGVEGLAFQAACKIAAERSSAVDLRLRGAGLNVELAGDIVWLGGTQREAGIHFKGISAEANQQIAEWIVRQSTAERSQVKPNVTNPEPEKLRHASVSQFLPAVPSPQVSTARTAGENGSKNSVRSTPDMLISPPLRSYTQTQAHSDPSGQTDKDPPQTQRLVFHAQGLELPRSTQPLELSKYKTSSIAVKESAIPPRRAETADAIGSQSKGLKSLPGASERRLENSRRGKWLGILLASWRRTGRQQKLLLAGAAVGFIWIFSLILTLPVAQVTERPEQSVKAGASNKTESAPVASDQVNQSQPGSAPFSSAKPVTKATTPRTSSFLDDLSEIVFGSGLSTKTSIDQHQDSVNVWVSKGNGYYYCADSPFYKTMEPGTLMPQGTALQSGYQPKLGQPCD
jgi:hypothetical protein